jgi:hypothetical protein
MRRILAAAAVTAAVMAGHAGAQEIGGTPPELEAVRWYNTPPMTLERLRGKAILVEVFRTW